MINENGMWALLVRYHTTNTPQQYYIYIIVSKYKYNLEITFGRKKKIITWKVWVVKGARIHDHRMHPCTEHIKRKTRSGWNFTCHRNYYVNLLNYDLKQSAQITLRKKNNDIKSSLFGLWNEMTDGPKNWKRCLFLVLYLYNIICWLASCCIVQNKHYYNYQIENASV